MSVMPYRFQEGPDYDESSYSNEDYDQLSDLERTIDNEIAGNDESYDYEQDEQ